jgi:hypothetical protein
MAEKKPEPKVEKKLTADEKLDLLLKLAAANGWSIPKALQ